MTQEIIEIIQNHPEKDKLEVLFSNIIHTLEKHQPKIGDVLNIQMWKKEFAQILDIHDISLLFPPVTVKAGEAIIHI